MNDTATKNRNVTSEEDREELQQFVTFTIGSEIYGVDVLKVQEIIGITEITYVPNSLPFMKGVINLRGNVVPVVDLRIKFRMEEREYDATTVIIIVEVKSRSIGMIVDAVSDVIDIAVTSIHDTPHFSASIETDYIRNIGRKDDLLVIILNVDKILTAEEMETIRKKEAG
ncbi:MAG: purine-binding chemotaxis protein CheW [Spirochaetes bacterium]|nr:purine-binding chemotaxis protein CheW [Spirochaetota bacterium]